MFRDVPGCSGIFRNVPGCSMFRVLSTPHYLPQLNPKGLNFYYKTRKLLNTIALEHLFTNDRILRYNKNVYR